MIKKYLRIQKADSKFWTSNEHFISSFGGRLFLSFFCVKIIYKCLGPLLSTLTDTLTKWLCLYQSEASHFGEEFLLWWFTLDQGRVFVTAEKKHVVLDRLWIESQHNHNIFFPLVKDYDKAGTFNSRILQTLPLRLCEKKCSLKAVTLQAVSLARSHIYENLHTPK